MSFQTIENLCQKYIKKKKRKKALENQSFLLYDDNLLFFLINKEKRREVLSAILNYLSPHTPIFLLFYNFSDHLDAFFFN